MATMQHIETRPLMRVGASECHAIRAPTMTTTFVVAIRSCAARIAKKGTVRAEALTRLRRIDAAPIERARKLAWRLGDR
jgi:hypothetical protein